MQNFDLINLIRNNWFKLHDSIRYLIIGTINSGISYVLFVIATFILGKEHYQLCVALQWGFCSIISYFNQKFFVFNTKGNYLKEYLKCCQTWFLSYLINAFLINLFVEKLHANVYISQAFSMFTAAIFTYTIFKIYAFKTPKGAK